MAPELRHLRYFVAVAEERSLTRAAQRLHLGQPSLSEAVRQLERAVGAELLLRGPRGVELAPAGETLLEHARRVLRHADGLDEALRAHREGSAGRLRIGLLVDGLGPLTAPLLAALRTARPGVALSVRQVEPGEGAAAVAEGRLDVALLHGPQADERVALVPLFTEPRVVAVAARSALANAPALAAADVVGRPVETRNPRVPEAWEGFFTLVAERGGEQPERVGEPARSFDEVLWNVAVNDVVLTLPAHVAATHPAERFGVRYVPAADLAPVGFVLAHRRDTQDGAVRAFRALARRVVRELHPLVPGAVPAA
jgi:LysR family hca operon transcriptional activator